MIDQGPGGVSDAGADDGHAADADRFLAEVAIDAEVESRRRERWIRRRLAEEADLASVLSSATGTEMALHLSTGDRVAGNLSWVGSDVVELRRRHGACWLALSCVGAVELASGPATPTAPATAGGRSLLDVLLDLCVDRCEVVITLVGGTAVRGTMEAAGEMATVRTRPTGRTAYVSLDSIACVSLPS